MLYKLEAKMGMQEVDDTRRAVTDPLPMLNIGPKLHATRPVHQRSSSKMAGDGSDLRRELLALRRMDTPDVKAGSFEAARLRKTGKTSKQRPASLASMTWMSRPTNLSIHSATAAPRSGSRPHSPRSTIRTGHLSPLSPRTVKSACKSCLTGSMCLQSPVLLAIEEGLSVLKSPRLPKKYNAFMSAIQAQESSGLSTAMRSPKTPKRLARTYDEGFDAGVDTLEERKPLMSPLRQI